MPPEGNETGNNNTGEETSSLQSRLAKHQGDAMALAASLLVENRQKDERITELNKKVPKEGAVILVGDEAKVYTELKAAGKPAEILSEYKAFQALGKPATELKKVLDDSATAEARVKELEKNNTLREIADEEKLKFSVLRDLDLRDGGLQYEKRDFTETKDGKTVTSKRWHVKDGNSWRPLGDYAADKWADYQTVLKGSSNQEQGTAGVRVPEQQRSGNESPDNKYQKMREKKKKEEEERKPKGGSALERLALSEGK